METPIWRLPPQVGDSRLRGCEGLSTAEAYKIMERWDIKFSGARGSDAEEFLIQIAEYRALATIADADVLSYLPFFLTGIARHWYRVCRAEWLSWSDFEAAWRIRFGDPDFQFALRDKIAHRVQGEYESVADYLTCMRALCSRLNPPWSQAKQLSYAHRGLLTRLQVAIRRDEVTSFAILEFLAKRVERAYSAERQNRAPPLPEHSICPNLAYRPPPRGQRPSAMAATDISGAAESAGTREQRGNAPKKKRLRRYRRRLRISRLRADREAKFMTSLRLPPRM